MIQKIAEKLHQNQTKINDWFDQKSRVTPPSFYCSVDIRDSGFKFAPVDCNLYPAGFNNICATDLNAAPSLLKVQIQNISKLLNLNNINKILIIPEEHTSNKFYLENVYFLNQIFLDAGYETKVGWYQLDEKIELTTASGKKMEALPINIQGGVLAAEDFVPDLILLNNDFSSGYPKKLDPVTQPILPTHQLGWHSRQKIHHFNYYNQLVNEFCNVLGIDPWYFNIETEIVRSVNFSKNIGVEEVADKVDSMIQRLKENYKKHGIDQEPFIFVKSNTGTYGMGIMVVRSAEELRQMNRRTKNKMSSGKNRSLIDSVIIQEGIPTITKIENLAAEPVIYLFGAELMGGFLRSNTQKGAEENLNTKGMTFKRLCMSDLRNLTGTEDQEKIPTLEIVYGTIARLSALANGIEIQKNQEFSQ